MLKNKRFTGFYRFLLASSLVWISSTGFAAKTDDHAGDTADGAQSTASPKPTVTKTGTTGDDQATRRTAALKRMKDELKKLGNNSLRQLTGQVAQFQKVDPDILGGIVDKLPDLSEDASKSLKDTFKDVFPELGDTADLDLARTLAELGAERFGDDTKGEKGDDKKTDEEKVKEALDKILKGKEDDLAKKEKEAKELADKAKDDFNDQLKNLLKAAGLDDNLKNKNNLGDIPPPNDAGAGETPTDSGSGSGSGDGGGGSGSGGGGDKGASTPTDKGDTKSAKTDTPSNNGLNLSSNKSESAKPADTSKEEEFSLPEKKKAEDKPSTIQTGAKEPAASEPVPQSDVVDPSLGLGNSRPMLAGSSSAASGVSPFPSSLGEGGGGGGSGAGIDIKGASAPASAGGEGDVFSGLGNPAAQPPEDRGRFFYQRTSDKDWVSAGGSVEEGGSGEGGGGNEAPAYGSAKPPAPTLASLGISSPAREESAGEAQGVFAVNPVKKLCKSSVGSSIGVCSPRAVKAASSNQAMPARALGSLYQKAKASGFIREARP